MLPDLETVVQARQAAYDRGDVEEFYRQRARENRLRAQGNGGARLHLSHASEEPGVVPPSTELVEQLTMKGLSEDAAKVLAEKALSSKERKAIPKGDFAVPSKAPESGSYPIHDLAHARNALARSSGKPEESSVKAKVYAKYPQLKKGKSVKEAQLDPDRQLGLNPLLVLRDAVAELDEGQTLALTTGVTVEHKPAEGDGDPIFVVESESVPGDTGHILQASTPELAARHAYPIHKRRRGRR